MENASGVSQAENKEGSVVADWRWRVYEREGLEEMGKKLNKWMEKANEKTRMPGRIWEQEAIGKYEKNEKKTWDNGSKSIAGKTDKKEQI